MQHSEHEHARYMQKTEHSAHMHGHMDHGGVEVVAVLKGGALST